MTNIDTNSASLGALEKNSDDSFERYYNKDLDLDEGNSHYKVKKYRLGSNSYI